jgi:hypothetical protein
MESVVSPGIDAQSNIKECGNIMKRFGKEREARQQCQAVSFKQHASDNEPRQPSR